MQHRREEYADNLSRRNMKPARQPPFSLSPSLYMNFSFSFFESARGFSISLYGLIHQFWSGSVYALILFCSLLIFANRIHFLKTFHYAKSKILKCLFIYYELCYTVIFVNIYFLNL